MYHSAPFRFVVYVGERSGGCTGDYTLHRVLKRKVQKNW
jgi:hypothetical protein